MSRTRLELTGVVPDVDGDDRSFKLDLQGRPKYLVHVAMPHEECWRVVEKRLKRLKIELDKACGKDNMIVVVSGPDCTVEVYRIEDGAVEDET